MSNTVFYTKKAVRAFVTQQIVGKEVKKPTDINLLEEKQSILQLSRYYSSYVRFSFFDAIRIPNKLVFCVFPRC